MKADDLFEQRVDDHHIMASCLGWRQATDHIIGEYPEYAPHYEQISTIFRGVEEMFNLMGQLNAESSDKPATGF